MDGVLFLVALGVATIAMATGLSGALLLSVVFISILGMDAHAAFGLALLTQAFGFLSGLALLIRVH